MRRLTTIHFPDTRDKKSGKVIRTCTQHKPECDMSHYYAIPAIETRGAWRFGDMLSNASIENLLTAYTRAGGKFGK